MPTYEYKCDACDHEFEQFQSITAPSRRKCPSCGERKLRRLIGIGAGVIFKGSGFYQTDYRSEDYKKAAEADKPKAESSGEKGKAPAAGAGEKGKSPAAGSGEKGKSPAAGSGEKPEAEPKSPG